MNPLSGNKLAKKLNVGLKVGKFTTTHGTIMLVPEPLFRRGNEDRSVLVDLNHIRYVFHKGRDTKLLENRQGPGFDSVAEEWMSDVSLMFENEGAHSWIINVPV